MPEKDCFALALDGGKHRVNSVTSNIVHLLWSGIVNDDQADVVARQLMAETMYSGWGVRTMASDQGGYNPVEYHNGTVWPHDNSLIAAGLRRYGASDTAGYPGPVGARRRGGRRRRLGGRFALAAAVPGADAA